MKKSIFFVFSLFFIASQSKAGNIFSVIKNMKFKIRLVDNYRKVKKSVPKLQKLHAKHQRTANIMDGNLYRDLPFNDYLWWSVRNTNFWKGVICASLFYNLDRARLIHGFPQSNENASNDELNLNSNDLLFLTDY